MKAPMIDSKDHHEGFSMGNYLGREKWLDIAKLLAGHTYSILACPEFYNQQHQPFSNGREQCSVFHDPLRVFHGKEHFLGQVFVAVYFSAGSISLLELYRFI